MDDPHFSALRRGNLTLHLINGANFAQVRRMFSGFPDSDYLLSELDQSYIPKYDLSGRRIMYGFYTMLDSQLAGASLRGFTGADTLLYMRGRGVAPGSKPHLFYLGFYLLGLHRIETGCATSNAASRRSIEKTPGFVHEGTLRSYTRNEQGEFEDEHFYGILRADWEQLYNPNEIEVIL